MQAKQAIRKAMVTILPGASIGDAAELMNQAVVGALVVLDNDRPVGIVTDRDLVVRAMVKRLPLDARVDSVMTTHLVTLGSGWSECSRSTTWRSTASTILPRCSIPPSAR